MELLKFNLTKVVRSI
ncbi:hypothetical protein CGLO_18386 [Colletotrichum gloeosporioides Cg-14]|uniref:Uncharacterized protein n=1 Tax=Colletotrichum gloeosporioides (strain Cg-14) TaxID=1237896 RepID=T0L4B9_COLGC|nr:hypothetical protein CGLO_18386 [Colletotrichum gloeosporioides Cg-14]